MVSVFSQEVGILFGPASMVGILAGPKSMVGNILIINKELLKKKLKKPLIIVVLVLKLTATTRDKLIINKNIF